MWWGTRWRRWSGGLGQGSRGAGEQGWPVCGGGARETAMEAASKQHAKCGRRSHGSWETGDGGYRYSGRCGYGGVAESRDDGPWKTPCWRRVSVADFPNSAPPRHPPQQLDLRLGDSPMATHSDAWRRGMDTNHQPLQSPCRPRSAFPRRGSRREGKLQRRYAPPHATPSGTAINNRHAGEIAGPGDLPGRCPDWTAPTGLAFRVPGSAEGRRLQIGPWPS